MKRQELNTNVYDNLDYVEHVTRYITFEFGNIRTEPNFKNMQAYGHNNPYSSVCLFGQCTWLPRGDSMKYIDIILYLLVLDGIMLNNSLMHIQKNLNYLTNLK